MYCITWKNLIYILNIIYFAFQRTLGYMKEGLYKNHADTQSHFVAEMKKKILY